MNKLVNTLTALLITTTIFSPLNVWAQIGKRNPHEKNKQNNSLEATTRNDAVIFKIHDITPVSENGIVTGCDYYITLYNRTAINFRTFTINFDWEDSVEESFRFDRYVETTLGKNALNEQKELFKKDKNDAVTKTSATINAFGADKQISVKSFVNTEKCYLLLNNPEYTVTPCEMTRMDGVSAASLGAKEQNCNSLFQYVGHTNPEYFGDFKKMSLTEIAAQNLDKENQELADIDVVIKEIVENIGNADTTLNTIE